MYSFYLKNIIKKTFIYFIIFIYFIRNIIISNIFVKIYAFEYNNKLYYTNYIYFIPFNLFKFLFYKFNINIIYEYDNIIFISYNKVQIAPPLILFEIKHNNLILDLTTNIINYNNNIPLEFIIKHELMKNSIINYNNIFITIKYFLTGKPIEKKFIVNNICKKNILFNNITVLNKNLLLYKCYNYIN